MTGVLPITKYSSGSELNMFLEYDMATKIKYSEYFGFLDCEVDTLYRTYRETTPQPKITRRICTAGMTDITLRRALEFIIRAP